MPNKIPLPPGLMNFHPPKVGNPVCLHHKLQLALAVLQASLPRAAQTLISGLFTDHHGQTPDISRRSSTTQQVLFFKGLNSLQTTV